MRNRIYRVTHRRADWGPTTKPKTKIFWRRPDLDRHLALLASGDRTDLAPVTEVHVDTATVTSWEPFDPEIHQS